MVQLLDWLTVDGSNSVVGIEILSPAVLLASSNSGATTWEEAGVGDKGVDTQEKHTFRFEDK